MPFSMGSRSACQARAGKRRYRLRRAQQRSALPVVSLTSESQTNTVSRPTSVAIDCDSSSNGPSEKSRPTRSQTGYILRDEIQLRERRCWTKIWFNFYNRDNEKHLQRSFQSGKTGYSPFVIDSWENTALAEEATQDVFVKVYTSIHSFRKESKFSHGCIDCDQSLYQFEQSSSS